MSVDPVFSVVLCTYNRGTLLADAVRSLLALAPGSPPHEILVVDNNSRDQTRELVHGFIPESGGRLRYLFEGKQGLSHARNAGIAASRGRIVAFTDDDVRASPDWLIALDRAFRDHPDVVFAGGKVLPLWPVEPPRWLTAANWGPLALVDYGDVGFETSRARAVCLVGANMAYRREVFAEFGGFEPFFQHEQGAVSAVEDHEFELRLHRAGLKGWYEPAAVIHAEVQPNRLTKAYHRKWHFDHGRATVRMIPRDHYLGADLMPTPFSRNTRRLLNAPIFLYRQIATSALHYVRAAATRRPDRQFAAESDIREALGSIHYYHVTSRQPGAELAPAAPPVIATIADGRPGDGRVPLAT